MPGRGRAAPWPDASSETASGTHFRAPHADEAARGPRATSFPETHRVPSWQMVRLTGDGVRLLGKWAWRVVPVRDISFVRGA